jgi:hypothetical protein
MKTQHETEMLDAGNGRSHASADRTEQIHIRLLPQDATLLRQLASSRGQTLSGAIRYLVRKEYRGCRS